MARVKRTVRETVEALRHFVAESRGHHPSIRELAKAMDLDPSVVSRRIAEAEGYIVRGQYGPGESAQLALGRPLPEDDGVLPTPEEVEDLCVSGCREEAA